MLRIAINGFGRIGRTALRLLENDKDIEVVAINDLTDPLQLAYLYKYDSVHRTNKSKVSFDEDELFVKGRRIKVYAESDPSKLPWRELNVDVVLECTGVFTSTEKCMPHITSGAKHVVISAPAKDDAKTIVYGVNDNILNEDEIDVVKRGRNAKVFSHPKNVDIVTSVSTDYYNQFFYKNLLHDEVNIYVAE